MVTFPKRLPQCGTLTPEQEATLREIVGQVAGRWPLWTMHVLTQAEGPLRFARLLERIDGISQKMLTQTLRGLERDGFVTRTVYPEVPPRVEYELTDDGREIMAQFTPFWYWIMGKLPNIETARARFDAAERQADGLTQNQSSARIDRWSAAPANAPSPTARATL